MNKRELLWLQKQNELKLEVERKNVDTLVEWAARHAEAKDHLMNRGRAAIGVKRAWYT
jgi:hypothetical protein